MTRPGVLWRIYLFICAMSLLLGGAVVLLQWKSVKDEAGTEVRYANSLVSYSLEALLRKYEAMLEVLGERLLELDGLNGDARARALVDHLLSRNLELAGFGLADLDGQLVLTSSNIDRTHLPNLKQSPQTAESFARALESDHMIMGRSYYMPALKEWVIPLRYRIRDAEGQVVAVMTTGMKMNSTYGLWSHKAMPEHLKFLVVRHDLYRQFGSYVDESEYDNYYGKPVDARLLQHFEQELRKEAHMDLAAFQHSGQVVTLFTLGRRGNMFLTGVKYEPHYEYFVLTAIARETLFSRLSVPAIWTVSLLLVFNLVLYGIFRATVRMQRETGQRLNHLATHDQLTGLPNRRYLVDCFAEWQQAQRQHFSVLFVDLDNFKAINDLHGHSVGDVILREVARRIEQSFSSALTIRQGGDEFIVLMDGEYDSSLEQTCKRFIGALRVPIHCGGLEFSIRASIGVAQSLLDGSELDELLRKADMAMYEAKRLRCGIYAYASHLEQRSERSGHIERELSSALEKGQFHLVYQPQVDAHTGRLLGVEALLRWQNPALGNVPPDELISVAESMGMMRELGHFVITTALEEISRIETWPGEGDFRLAINTSVSQLFDGVFVTELIELGRKHKQDGLQLVVEITESLFIEDVESARVVLDELRSNGLGISLDDFGTGYSSLSLLSKLPISELKIDKGFVQDILTDQQDRQLIQSIISLGKGLGIPVLAEGVETAAQASLLDEFGCDRFQGYHFARPMPVDALTDFLASSPDLRQRISQVAD